MANNYTDSFEGNPYYIKKGKQLSAAGMTAALNTKEKVANKVTTINNQSTDAQYPSAKVVYDTLSGTNNDILHKASAETITGVKTFGTTTAAAEPLLGVAKTTDATNSGTKFATEAQVYAVSDAASGKQDKIGAGTAKNIVAYSGTAGTFGALTRTTAINTKKEDLSDDKIPTERAIANYLADLILPKGTILAMESMFYYNSADDAFKAKWKVCDGNNNTPNLQHKFLRGFLSGDTATGGADSQNIALQTKHMPKHTHGFTGDKQTGYVNITTGSVDGSVFSHGTTTSVYNNNGSASESRLDFSMTPSGTIGETGGGSAASGYGESFNVQTVPSYYTVIYIMKMA
ncbi:MAG: hypothetical protein LBK68_03455 [Candidatus Margulisbacteria bacterium]|nr:hypothetical protein [Candidatus Margulisiibacteriota bacterium]